jgi:hypothetical protein
VFKAYSLFLSFILIGLRSALVFTLEDFQEIRRIVDLGQQLFGGNSPYALLAFGGKPLGASSCHKLWVQMFLKAGEGCPTYPIRITYGLFRAQVTQSNKAYSFYLVFLFSRL